MSRSYKKTPVYKAMVDSRFSKRASNKKIRKQKDLPMGKSKIFRKVSETWEICDYRTYFSREMALEEWEDVCDSEEACLWEWKKRMIRKQEEIYESD